MELTPAQIQALQALTVSSGKGRQENLTSGQQLLAKVVAMNNANGEATLNVNDSLVKVKTQLQLQLNQTLQLTVAQSKNQLIFQLPQKAVEAAVLQQSLREVLPQQKPVSQLLNQVQQFVKQAKNLKAAQPILNAVQKFVNQLPSSKQLSQAQGLKSAIKQSGIFLEKNLLNNKTGEGTKTISGDLKNLLLNLKSSISRQQTSAQNPLPENKPNPSQSTQNSRDVTSGKTDIQSNKLINELNKSQVRPETVRTNSGLSADPKALAANSRPTQQTADSNKLIDTMRQASKSDVPTQTQAQNKVQTAAQLQSNPVTKTQQISNDKTVNSNSPLPQQTSKTVSNAAMAKNINPTTTKAVTNTDNVKTNNQQQIINNTIKQGIKSVPPGMVRHVISSSTLSTTLPTLQTLSPSSPTGQVPGAAMYRDKTGFNIKDALAFVPVKEQAMTSTSAGRNIGLIEMLENLVKSIDSAISRVQLHQLHTVQENELGKLAWSLEIPVRDEDEIHLIQMEFEQEQSKDDDKENIVTVNLAVNLQNLGPVYARITLMDENVSVVIWAERDETFQLAQASVNDLHENLQKSGFTSDNIACHQGCPPQAQDVPIYDSSKLLDIKA